MLFYIKSQIYKVKYKVQVQLVIIMYKNDNYSEIRNTHDGTTITL